MNHYFSSVSDKENELLLQHKDMEQKQNPKDSYHGKVCIKPWGYEFLAYESTKLAIWCVTVNKGHATSLHCHFKKDTLLIVLSGCARIEYFNGDVQALSTLETLFIPRKKFHSIGSFAETTVIIEVEIFGKDLFFSDKNDLLRINDQYHRKATGYQSSVQFITKDLAAYDYFEIVNSFEKIKDGASLQVTNSLPLTKSSNSISLLLSGSLLQSNTILKEGSILDSTLKYTPLDLIQILTISKVDWKEDKKIIYDYEHLAIVKKELNSLKRQIVLTSGCFDILHVGHLNTLKTAKSLGDTLLVCLSSDAQIKALKGNTRPVNTFEDRLKLFKTIEYVDYIFPYEELFIETEETLGTIMKTLDPDLWVKGSDYTVERIKEKHPYLRRIHIIPLVENRSTTNIIRKINTSVKE